MGKYLKIFGFFFLLFCIWAFIYFLKEIAHARYFIKGTVAIEDSANILSVGEKKILEEKMEAITDDCNVFLYTGRETDRTVRDAAKTAYGQNSTFFNQREGIIFIINAETKTPQVVTMGKISEKISEGHCEKIANEVWPFISDGEYYTGAINAFSKVRRLFAGLDLARVLRDLCFLGLAFILSGAALLVYIEVQGKHYRIP